MKGRRVLQAARRDGRVTRWVDPERLKQLLELEPPKEPVGTESLLDGISDTLMYSVNIAHPYFLNQLFSRYVFPPFLSSPDITLLKGEGVL